MGLATTSRRVILEAMLGLGAAGSLHAALDTAAWQAYEAVEEAWIRDRFELLVQHTPAALGAARVDLELKLADLQRRGMQFRHLAANNPALLRGGIWQLTALPVADVEDAALTKGNADYRKQTERIRRLSDDLRAHPRYDILHRAQIRLWKTPQYREIHRKYMGRMQELQRIYGGADVPPASVAN